MVRETSAPEPTVISVISFGRGTGVRSGLSIVQLRAIVGIVGGSWVERDNNKRLSRLINRITSVKHRTGSLTNMATWRNGSAFGFDRRRHQKVAGSSPAVVIFYLFFLLDFDSTHVMTEQDKAQVWLPLRPRPWNHTGNSLNILPTPSNFLPRMFVTRLHCTDIAKLVRWPEINATRTSQKMSWRCLTSRTTRNTSLGFFRIGQLHARVILHEEMQMQTRSLTWTMT